MTLHAQRKRAERIAQRFAAEHQAARPVTPPGWTAAGYAAYLEDADGGRAPFRLPPPDSTPTAAEILSRES